MDQDLPNTPGLGGYLLAVVISDLAMPGLLAIAALGDAVAHGTGDQLGDPTEWAGTLVVLATYALVFSIPFALVGVPLVHLISCRTANQLAHVVVAGAVGFTELFLLFAVPSAAQGSEDGILIGWIAGAWVGTAAMVGRAAVIPLVVGRRNRVRAERSSFERSNPQMPVK
jgi:hypothetical protein